MSDDLRNTLRVLESEYAGQPPVVRQSDLREINRLRTQLGLPLVDARLKVVGAADAPVARPKPKAKAEPDHSAARAVYRAYLDKKKELEAHRAYAERVARATGGPGQTPVRPLATMGTGGGPLLCDHCGKPMILEGGKFQGVHADVAWRRNPQSGWKSWILGGMVVEIAVNGTLRIYHGYPGHGKGCCNTASRQQKKAEDEYESPRTADTFPTLLAFVEHDFPDMPDRERQDLVNDILNTMYSYDPGIGVNRPTAD